MQVAHLLPPPPLALIGVRMDVGTGAGNPGLEHGQSSSCGMHGTWCLHLLTHRADAATVYQLCTHVRMFLLYVAPCYPMSASCFMHAVQ